MKFNITINRVIIGKLNENEKSINVGELVKTDGHIIHVIGIPDSYYIFVKMTYTKLHYLCCHFNIRAQLANPSIVRKIFKCSKPYIDGQDCFLTSFRQEII